MESHYNNFLTTFYKFVYDINRYCPSEGAAKILEIFNDLDFAKVIFKIYHLLKLNIIIINARNEDLFQLDFIILPDVNLSIIWPQLIRGQKKKKYGLT